MFNGGIPKTRGRINTVYVLFIGEILKSSLPQSAVLALIILYAQAGKIQNDSGVEFYLHNIQIRFSSRKREYIIFICVSAPTARGCSTNNRENNNFGLPFLVNCLRFVRRLLLYSAYNPNRVTRTAGMKIII